MQDSHLLAPADFQPVTQIDVLPLVGDSVICTDEEGRIIVFNAAAELCFGYRANEVIGQQVEMLLPQIYHASHAQHVRSFAKGIGTENRLMGTGREVIGRRKNGDEFPAEAKVTRSLVDGRTVLTVVHRDISERKELESLREAVARELDHRMKNVLSVVTSLIALSAADAVDVKDFVKSLTGRVRALANSQSAFRFGEDQIVSLGDLLRLELAQYQTLDGTNVSIGGPPVSVSPRAAQMLSLAVHELATNATKYGSLGVAGGHVSVTSAFTGEGKTGTLTITWRESGGPPVVPPQRLGFGTTLIKRIVANALHAEVTIEYQPDGLICRMALPRAVIEAHL